LVSAIAVCGVALLGVLWLPALWAYVVIVPLFIVGLLDLSQTHHSIIRNFPVLGHMRFLMEKVRPEIYQYFIESDKDGAPFNRLTRSLVYRRAKKVNDTVPFGTQLDVYAPGYEWHCWRS